MVELRDRTAVVTGAASGIGRALARRFGSAGMRVLAADIDRTGLDSLVGELRSGGVTAEGVAVDVSSAPGNEELLAVADAHGPAHVVCLNAGVTPVTTELSATTLADWEWVLGVNLWGPIHGTRLFLPGLLARDAGHLVYTASLASLLAARNPYQISKHAVHALATAVRGHLAATGSAVRTTVVYTGPVATAIADSDTHVPDRWRGATTPTDARARERAAAAARTHGMPPDEVAELVHQAVEQGRPTVFTHPDRLPLVRAHLAELADDVEQAVSIR